MYTAAGTHYKFSELEIIAMIGEAEAVVKETLAHPTPPAPSKASTAS